MDKEVEVDIVEEVEEVAMEAVEAEVAIIIMINCEKAHSLG